MKNKPVPQLAKYNPKKGKIAKIFFVAIPVVYGLFLVKNVMTTVLMPQPTAAELEFQRTVEDLSKTIRNSSCDMTIVSLRQAELHKDTAEIEKYSKLAEEDKCFDLSSYR